MTVTFCSSVFFSSTFGLPMLNRLGVVFGFEGSFGIAGVTVTGGLVFCSSLCGLSTD